MIFHDYAVNISLVVGKKKEIYSDAPAPERLNVAPPLVQMRLWPTTKHVHGLLAKDLSIINLLPLIKNISTSSYI